jgi:hypothetical protein
VRDLTPDDRTLATGIGTAAGLESVGLSAAEARVLVVALAPSIEPAFEKIYAYANDDITRRWPTVAPLTSCVTTATKHSPYGISSSRTPRSPGTICLESLVPERRYLA